MSENRKPQPPIEPTTALVKLNTDPSAIQDTDPTIEVPDKGKILAAALFAITQMNTPEQTIRSSPVIKKGPDLISKSIQINTDGGKMESQTGCNMPCRNTNCSERCAIPDVHPASVMHYCPLGHTWN